MGILYEIQSLRGSKAKKRSVGLRHCEKLHLQQKCFRFKMNLYPAKIGCTTFGKSHGPFLPYDVDKELDVTNNLTRGVLPARKIGLPL